MRKLTTVFVSVMALYLLFFAGFNAGKHDYQSMGTGLILVAFLIGLLVVIVRDYVEDAVREALDEMHSEVMGKLDKVFQGAMEAFEHNALGATPIIKKDGDAKPRPASKGKKIPVKYDKGQNSNPRRVRTKKLEQTKLPLDKKK